MHSRDSLDMATIVHSLESFPQKSLCPPVQSLGPRFPCHYPVPEETLAQPPSNPLLGLGGLLLLFVLDSPLNFDQAVTAVGVDGAFVSHDDALFAGAHSELQPSLGTQFFVLPSDFAPRIVARAVGVDDVDAAHGRSCCRCGFALLARLEGGSQSVAGIVAQGRTGKR